MKLTRGIGLGLLFCTLLPECHAEAQSVFRGSKESTLQLNAAASAAFSRKAQNDAKQFLVSAKAREREAEQDLAERRKKDADRLGAGGARSGPEVSRN